MRLRSLLVIWICFLFLVTSAQEDSTVQKQVTAILKELAAAPNDSVKFEKYLELSNHWSYRDSLKAEYYLDEARKVVAGSISNYQRGLLHHFKANILFDFDFEKAKEEYMIADGLLEKSTFSKAYYYRAKLWNNYGSILQRQDSSTKFMDIIVDRVIPYARMAGDSIQVGIQLYNMGLLMGNIDEYDRAASYYDRSIHALNPINDAHEEKLMVYSNSAKNHIARLDFPKVREHLDSAEQNLRFVPNSMYQAYFYTIKGVYYRHMKDKDNALLNFEKGIEIAQFLNDKYDLNNIYYEMFYLYRDFKEYEKAKIYLLKYGEYGYDPIRRNQVIYHREMANLEYHLGNFEDAFRELRSYATIQDSLHFANRAREILDLEKKYLLVEHENEILKLQSINQEQELAIFKSKGWKVLAFGALFFAIAIGYFAWRLYQSKKRTLVQNKKLHEEELKSIRQEERMNQYDAILQGQELERNRLARDLHDGLGGLLAGVKLKLSSIDIVNQRDNVVEIPSIVKQLDYSINELRRISRNMMPESLLSMGLVPALEDLCKYMDSPQTTITFQHLELQSKFGEQLLIAAYRIVQELLTNAIKHANASEVILQCSEMENWLFITVEDNGTGMEKKEVNPNSGLGLNNIYNRIKLLHGLIDIESTKEQGTTIHIQIPIS